MPDYTTLLLPCQGDPVAKLWVPSTDGLYGLFVEVKAGEAIQSVRRKAESLGLRDGQVRILGLGQYASQWLSVWVYWVSPKQTPTDLQEVPVASTSNHPVLGPIVRKILAVQA
jgi:hypothetical protein